MARASLDGTILAESDRCEMVEGNYYFPPDNLKQEYFSPSSTHTTCFWKGTADYFSIKVGDLEIADGAWTYPQAKDRAKHIQGYVAFYTRKGITVTDGVENPSL